MIHISHRSSKPLNLIVTMITTTQRIHEMKTVINRFAPRRL